MFSKTTVLLVIDVQKGFGDEAWGRRNNPGAENNVARLIDAWRKDGRPIRHVHHASRSSTGHFRLGTRGHEPMDEATPATGEPVHVKEVNSAFIGTTLEQDLRNDGSDTLVVVGLTTNHCVSTTVRMAGNLGFTTYVVEDATAAFERKGLDGTIRPASEVHGSALSDLSEEFATIISTKKVLENSWLSGADSA